MFVDTIEIILSSGKGGAGSVSFRHEKFAPLGGPDGGDGGRGGDVYIKVDNNSHTLAHFKGKRELKAKNGVNGMGRNMYGKKGEDIEILVPLGTQVIDAQTNELLVDFNDDGMMIKFLEGGKGGLGNSHFKSSVNQRPDYAQPGIPGTSIKVRLELKLIADVGLVGFPNVGKSTLISVLSNAKPLIANYEFTTITPKLGVVEVDDIKNYVIADIPGIIEGAWEGKGLGLTFLKHIERTKCLLFIIDLANYRDPVLQYELLKEELKKFSSSLVSRPWAIALSKYDALNEEEIRDKTITFIENLKIQEDYSNYTYKVEENKISYFQDIENYDNTKPFFILPISSVTKGNINALKYALCDLVYKARK